MAAIDYSKYGATPEIDYSKYGAIPETSSNNQEINQPSYLQQVMHSPMQMGGDVLAGLATGGNNLNHSIVNAIQSLMGPSQITNKINSILPQQGADFSSAFGVNNPGIADKLIQGASQYAPFGAVGEGALAAQGLSKIPMMAKLAATGLGGSLFGATQTDDPRVGIPLGALAGAGGQLAGMGVGALAKGAVNKISQYAAPGIAKEAISNLDNPTTNAQAFSIAKNNYDQMSQKEGQAWETAKSQAQQADQSGVPYDNSGYTDALNTELNNLKTQSSRQSALARKNKEAISLIEGGNNSNGYLNDQHNSFSDAIEHNQALNADFENEVAPGQPLPFRTVNFAKSNLRDTLKDNLEQSGLKDTLGKTWNDANDLTKQKNQIFNEVISPKGKDDYSSFTTYLNGKSPFADRGNFVNDYMPSGSQESLGKMKQLGQMLGDEDLSKMVIKKNYFDTDKGVTPKSYLNNYNNLSPDERNYLFSPEQNQMTQALKNILEKNPDALKAASLGSHLWHGSLQFLLGGAAGHAMGLPFLEAGAGTALGLNAARAGLQKAFSNPAMARMWANYLTKAPQQSGLGATIGRGLPAAAMQQAQPQPMNLNIDQYKGVQ